MLSIAPDPGDSHRRRTVFAMTRPGHSAARIIYRQPADGVGLVRREMLRVGSAGLVGLALPDLLRASDASSGKFVPNSVATRKARNLIVMFLEGGPAHQDTWDMKPDAPEAIRGEFRPIATSLSGQLFCEHLPMLARVAHHFCYVRSVHHSINDHNAGAYQALTGRHPVENGRLIVRPGPDDFPAIGSVLALLRPSDSEMPDFVHLPDWMSNNGSFLPGEFAGFLGSKYDPFLAGDPSLPTYQVPGLTLPRGLDFERMTDRRLLLDRLERTIDAAAPAFDGLSEHRRAAFAMISGEKARAAFDIGREPAKVRERYGLDSANPRTKEARQFGGLPHLGQCLLMARRLIEADVRVVTVCTGARFDQAWDTHRQHFPLLKQSILPMFDRAFSALIEDLHQRGLLEETLVVAMGEFGRTPRVGQITSGAGADAGGRDHWPPCYTVLMAGGGVPAGAWIGESDRFAAYPAKDPVTPQDIAATIFRLMGLDLAHELQDSQNRPFPLSTGTPIRGITG
ncbi:DUF1501 domain-containing protein [bacterium]|nr:DUF1501 domain-containing protein [bacterium]